jgi:hypothetical protein
MEYATGLRPSGSSREGFIVHKYDEIMAKYPNADKLDDQQRFGAFLMIETMWGRGQVWKEMLEMHDTHGLPFDIIYLKVKERDLLPDAITSEIFSKGMAKARTVL